MIALSGPRILTGRWRVRAGWRGRPIIEVEIKTRCIHSLKSGPWGDNVTDGYWWQRARIDDLIAISCTHGNGREAPKP